jgi:hypothetical protein
MENDKGLKGWKLDDGSHDGLRYIKRFLTAIIIL